MKEYRLDLTLSERAQLMERLSQMNDVPEKSRIKTLLNTQPVFDEDLRTAILNQFIERAKTEKNQTKQVTFIRVVVPDEVVHDLEATAERWLVSLRTVLRCRLLGLDIRGGSTKSSLSALGVRAAKLLAVEESS